MITLASVAIASFTLAQISIAQPGTGSAPTSTGERSVTAPPVGEISTVNEFTPGRSIKVTRASVGTQPVVYMLAPNALYVNEAGTPIDPNDIQPGARVRLDMVGTGPGLLTVGRVVVLAAK
jgi:hypothetical protein